MIHIASKRELSMLQENLLRLAAVAIALLASALIMLIMGYNPLDIYAKIISGSLGTAYRFRETVNKAIPLTVLSLGTAVAFRMRFWNIGAEGQFYLGAYGASLIAFGFPDLPAFVLLPLMFIAGFIFGGLWALIPGLLRAKFSASETLVTLMLNYVAVKWISYLQYGPWKDPAASGFPKIASFSKNAVLPSLFGIHIGWVITLVLAVLMFILLKKSKLGYEIDVLGESEATARYAGMNVSRIMLTAILISGGLCGIAGMMQASAIEQSLSDQLSGGLGFTAVITTWLARLSPPVTVVVSFLFSMLIQGGNFLQSSLKIPSSMAQILQGIIIFFVLGSEFFIRHKFVWIPVRKSAKGDAA
ncbi:ABC transporter permease [Brucepastera parasyntrophica]|uniref:ABC transporter permease n=1 Tax=Brucepastera parasyntrophica TaxID=2880008 RepID=UPI00210DE4FF|nr:ABC transporter permease [Brucepastera parasyntrophica]ULQ60919.1 ABC transporter permease [Brucepastera parasyntrophica]